jgi:hypothetical protein
MEAKESIDSRSAEVRKILESRVFHNTEVLKRLLDYLARQAIENPDADLKEYTIGVEAFGKPVDYATQVDSSVRVQIGKLRQRLDEYYRTEGAGDDVVVELPKGQFRLDFGRRIPAAEPQHAPDPIVRPLWFRRWIWIAGAAIALVALTVQFTYRTPAGDPSWTPAMDEFWRPFLRTPRPMLIAIGAPMFVKIGDDFFRDPSLNTWDSTDKSAEVVEIQRAVGATASLPVYNYTGIGEAEGAFEIACLLRPRGSGLTLRASNQVAWEDIGRYNMVFLGPPKYNLQTRDLPVQQDFEISHARVQNLHPTAGEARSFEEKWSSDRAYLEEGHALISRLPGLHGAGEVLILAGSSTECTRAAAEFVTSPEYVSALVARIRQAGSPRWFQAVIHSRFKSQVPITVELAAFHSLKGK